MKLYEVDLRRDDKRLAWAEALLRVLDESRPLHVPELPPPFPGMGDKRIAGLIHDRNRDEHDQRLFTSYRLWRKAEAFTKARNRLTLWSLLRMVQIFDEDEGTYEQADRVRAFLTDKWGLQGDGLERTLEGNIHEAAMVMAT